MNFLYFVLQACIELLQSPSSYTLQDLKFNNNGLGGGGIILANTLIECHKRSVDAGTPLALKTFVAGRNRFVRFTFHFFVFKLNG